MRPFALLGPDDPDPVEWANPDSEAPVLLVCEHAGRTVPGRLGDLGLPPGAIDGHIGWDIGAGALALGLAARLNAPLILQRYSRLVIDCNRPPGTAGSVPEVSDGVAVPANRDAGPSQLSARVRDIFEPLDRAVDEGFARHPRRAALSIHSYTPVLGGVRRPWHAGFLSRRDLHTAEALAGHVAAGAPDMALAVNQPYRIEDETDWFIPRHAEPRGLAHCLIEMRNDQLLRPEGTALWADYLSRAITAVLGAPE